MKRLLICFLQREPMDVFYEFLFRGAVIYGSYFHSASVKPVHLQGAGIRAGIFQKQSLVLGLVSVLTAFQCPKDLEPVCQKGNACKQNHGSRHCSYDSALFRILKCLHVPPPKKFTAYDLLHSIIQCRHSLV